MWVGVCVRVIRGGKKVISKKKNLRTLSVSFGHFKLEFEKKKRKVVIFPITRSGTMQKSKKKKQEKKIFYGTFSLAIFLFPVIKRAEKVSGFVFFRKGRGKM